MSEVHIYVLPSKIESNSKEGKNEPVIVIREGEKTQYCNGVKINGPSEVFYSGPNEYLPYTHARVGIKTDSKYIEIIK